MEVQGYSGGQPLFQHLRYYDDDEDGKEGKMQSWKMSSRDKTKTTEERRMSSGGSVRSRRKERHSDATGPKKSSSKKTPPSLESEIRETANKCIENSFPPAKSYSARSFVHSLANPCGISIPDENIGHPEPTTPSTVCSSSSDDNSQTSRGESLETASTSLTGRRESRRPFSPARSTNLITEEGDIIVFVGSQQFRFPLSADPLDFRSKYFWGRRRQADHFLYVDLSAHSPEEFATVMDFFEEDSAADTWNNISWKNLPSLLPWLVEFQAMPLLSAVDSFLLHNGLSNRWYRGESGNKNRCIGLSTLLSLTEIAFACGLSSTKMHAQKLLRQSLLRPRKQTDASELDSSRLGEAAAEDIELEWTLQDLQLLAKILETNDELREYVWASAVIIYLPHDLDISDSTGLVKNILFPYLLREGMMQMMIVEGLESSYQANDNSMHSSGTSSTNLSDSKLVGTSFSEHTSCSDTTIPTTPSERKTLTDKDLQRHVQNIMKKLTKFQVEKETNAAAIEEAQHNSMLVHERGRSPKSRSRRGHGGADNRSTSASTSRGLSTFAC